MGDPVGAARHAREHLRPGGTVLLVEPFAIDPRPRNIAENPMAALFYVASSCVCTPNSLSQEVGAALGAQAGEAKLRESSRKPASRHFRRAAQTPMNLIIEARARKAIRAPVGSGDRFDGVPRPASRPSLRRTCDGRIGRLLAGCGNGQHADRRDRPNHLLRCEPPFRNRCLPDESSRPRITRPLSPSPAG